MVRSSRVLGQGSIVWALIRDPRGANPKERPVVIISPTDAIVAGAEVAGVAVSSSVPSPPPPNCVELPWQAQGNAATGFRKPSWAVCDWAVVLRYDDVGQPVGFIAGDALRRVLDQAIPPKP